MSESNVELNAQTPAASPVQNPACQKCGRQDETLRLVVFPFVFSLVVITFRRAFTGLWCKTHRTQQQLIAGLISSLFGWLGIPYGFVYTPVALFQLAKGGVQPADANVQILSALADEKIKKGDTAAAVRCLEECMKFRDDPEIRNRLNQIRPRYGTEPEPVGCTQVGTKLVGAIFLSLLIGTGIGLLDYLRGFFLGLLLGSSTIPIVLVILAWAPLLAVICLGGFGLAGIIERTLTSIKFKSSGLAISFGIVAALSVIYGIFEGIVVADNIYAALTHQFQSVGQLIVVSIITFFAGGFFGMAGTFQNLNVIFIVILLLAAIFFLWIGIWTARETIRWQQRITPDSNI